MDPLTNDLLNIIYLYNRETKINLNQEYLTKSKWFKDYLFGTKFQSSSGNGLFCNMPFNWRSINEIPTDYYSIYTLGEFGATGELPQNYVCYNTVL